MPSLVRNSALLPLAFGDRAKQRFAGLREFAGMLEESGYRVLDLAAGRGAAPLAVETAFVNLPSVTMLAISSSSHRVITQRGGRVSLCFGVEGSGTLTAGRVTSAYRRAAGVLLPEGPVEWRIDTRASDFELSLDRRRLAATARVMLGLGEDAPLAGWNLDDLRPVPAKVGVVDGLATLIGIAIQADRYRSQPRVLEASGLEDQCYRQAVFLLMPEPFQQARTIPSAAPATPSATDRLCDWLRANLHSTTTLTDMERFSGLAARTLQLSFLKRFELSPMAWLREQRLEAARTMLEHSQGMDAAAAVDSVAASCGFGSAANLRKRYRMRFGESTAETLRAAK
jgi:AraC-like DNA-binding protein